MEGSEGGRKEAELELEKGKRKKDNKKSYWQINPSRVWERIAEEGVKGGGEEGI